MLDACAFVLIALHGFGAALGAGGALFAEIFYAKATADGHLDRRERDWFRSTFFALKWGMGTVLVTGLLLIFVQYFLPDSPERVLHPALWAQNALAVIVLGFAYALSRKRVTWHIGAASIFAGWWMIFALDTWQGDTYPFLVLMVVFAAFAGASILFWGYVGTLARASALQRIVDKAHHHKHHAE